MLSPKFVFILILAGTLALFVTKRVRVDVAAMLTLLALALTGILTPSEALAGFSSEPAIIVASVFVISAAMSATGLTETVGRFIARAAGSSEWRAVIVIMPTVAALSALSHHLMVTAMMLPILLKLSREQQLPASRLLMPMSLAASLGTTLTLFSAPAFLLTSNMLKDQGAAQLDVFAITPIGLVLVLLAMLFMSLGRWLLPRRGAERDEDDYLQLDRYYTELIVSDESRWTGKPLQEFQNHMRGRVSIVEWLRDGVTRARVPDALLEAGDVFTVRASPDELASMETEPGIELHAIAKYGEPSKDSSEAHLLVQVVVAPRSEFIGSSIAQIDFLRTLNVVVIGLWRKDEWVHDELSKLRLQEGDLLVLKGTPETFAELAHHRGFLMMVPFSAKPRARHRALLTLGTIGFVVAGAASEVVATHLAFLAGAVALVLLRCVSIEQAYREIDVRIYVMIAGVIPLAVAMDKTGTAAAAAAFLQQVTTGWSPLAVLLAVFWGSAMLTQILSDSATVVLLVPIALALALGLKQPPEPFAICTALGAVAAFLTPIGHHGNLLILNPGRYTFGDFLKVGVPLTILIGLVSAWLTRYLWLDGPLLPF